MASNDSIQKTFIVAFLLCMVCSVVVSTAAVVLKPLQIANKEKDFKINILKAGGLYEQGIAEGKSIAQMFGQVSSRLVDLDSGDYTEAVDVDTYDQRKAGKDPKLSDPLSAADDIAKISSREKYAKIYLVQEGDALKKVILPIKGYGLWSTLYGFISLDADLNTVAGLTFYEHAETPGLGGEVDNPNWKALWPGKKVYDQQQVALTVIKGKVSDMTPDPDYKIDGLSGATLTTRGIDNLVKFWMGDMGYAKFLNKLKNGEV
ncbi:MAG: Na(+)-translocating NADH-quinone reductase subunit C [Cellvibrionaceae bacterium]|nr:Na(+)-translocating NADH-quinone reductase subunit C [Cellvibrionaceae bacterium]